MKNIPEVLGWMQIAVSPFLIGLVIGFFVYISIQSFFSLILGIIISIIGLIIGIVLATKIMKTKGTVNFLSKLMSNKEFPNLDKTV